MKNLIIIGNGFDLAHELPTKYSDFGKFLCKNPKHKKFYELLTAYIAPEDLWNSFEEALGNFDQEQLKEDNSCYLMGYGDDDWADSAHHDYQYMIENSLSFSTQIPSILREWIECVDIEKISKKIVLSINLNDDKNVFVNFNYTATLERIYRVNRSNILYIHGCINNDMELVLGHHDKSTFTEELDNWNDEDHRVFEGNYIINSFFKSTYKDTKKIIKENQDFFDKLSSISNIYILGHSLSNIDLDYFRRIREMVQDSCKWHISYFDDRNKCLEFAENLAINNFELMTLSTQPISD